jgi:hypothetical protein
MNFPKTGKFLRVLPRPHCIKLKNKIINYKNYGKISTTFAKIKSFKYIYSYYKLKSIEFDFHDEFDISFNGKN